MTDPKPFLDEDGNPYEPYTAEELAIMWETHHPQAEDGDSWFTGRWLATVKELQGEVQGLTRILKDVNDMTSSAMTDDAYTMTGTLGYIDLITSQALEPKEPKEGTK